MNKIVAMNKAEGRVTLSGSDLGVPGLLVTLYDARPGSHSAHGEHRSPADLEEDWTRLASGVTGDGGHFPLAYAAQAIHGTEGQGRPDLVLTFSGPESGGAKHKRSAPGVMTTVRRNASPSESFLMCVEKTWLKSVGVQVPGPKSAEENAADRRHAAEQQAAAKVEANKAVRAVLEAKLQRTRDAEAKFDSFLAALSGASADRRNNPDGRYVARGASVQEATDRVIRAGIEQRVNQATRVGAVQLTDEQASQFKDSSGNFLDPVSALLLDPIIRPAADGSTVSTYRVPPTTVPCRTGVERYDCLKYVAGGDGQDGPPSGDTPPGGNGQPPDKTGPNGGATTGGDVPTQDVPGLIQKLVKDLSSPEESVVFGVPKRADLGDIKEGVKGFELHTGPVDTPALYDFHHLQIAFEHVWQELFDEKTVQTGKALYEKLVELGVDPNDYALEAGDLNLNLLGDQIGALTPTVDAPSQYVVEAFDVSPEEWAVLEQDHRTRLEELGKALRSATEQLDFDLRTDVQSLEGPDGDFIVQQIDATYRKQINDWKAMGQSIIRYGTNKLAASRAPTTFDQFHPLLAELEAGIKEPYRFTVYAANRIDRSVNFGLVTTYRQRWEPGTYQVGKLIKTVPMAPKEVRKFSKRTSVRTARAQKEVEKSLESRKTESSETSRVETQIVQKALNKTNFQISAQGGINVGIVNASASSGFDKGAQAESADVKKEFREAVFKAAEEYKTERETEITVNASEETTTEESGEISNPNDEITVTYLFYELQRRYQVSEQLHRVTPVVLVAQEFPKPSDIDDAWIVTYDWILRRVILDDSFVPAMNYLASKVVGDEVALREMFKNVAQQRRIAEELKDELVALRDQSTQRYAALAASIEKRAKALQDGGGDVPIPMPVGFLFGGDKASPEAAQIREDAALDAYERSVRQEKEAQARLDREVTALGTLTEQYTKELSDHLNRREQIDRLRVHLKQNIMYYMQAIWSHEPPDQRFFRLHDVQVPQLHGQMIYSLAVDPDGIPGPPNWTKPLKLTVHCKLDPNLQYDTLEEVADLDNLLGFKGNYMMFPLKKGNPLTDFLMAPYLDAALGVRDPDPLGDWTLADFAKYVCCLYANETKAQFEKMLPGLQDLFARLMEAPGSEGEEIIVPTDSLYIEALPGSHPILEDFKLIHRAVDVKRAQAETRSAELENLRFVARLLAGEREDPTIEKKVVIEGGNDVLVAPGDA
jgi:hypothetical protein